MGRVAYWPWCEHEVHPETDEEVDAISEGPPSSYIHPSSDPNLPSVVPDPRYVDSPEGSALAEPADAYSAARQLWLERHGYAADMTQRYLESRLAERLRMRLHILQEMVLRLYSLRRQRKSRAWGIELGLEHFEVVSRALTDPEVERDDSRALAFQQTPAYLIRLLLLERRRREALAICEAAIRLGLVDQTKGGYEARLRRLFLR